jgi:hypothetical protein
MIAAAATTFGPGGIAAGLIVAGVVGLGLVILYLVALIMIITKAGYSGAWILVLFMPVVVWIITSVVVYQDSRGPTYYYSTFNASTYVWAWVVDGIAYLVPVIFFFVFAFSDWPVRRKLRALQLAGAGALGSPDQGQSPATISVPMTVAPLQSSAVDHEPIAQQHRDLMPPVPVAVHPSEAVQTTFCTECGSSNEEGAEFCGGCGSRLAT